MKGRTEAKMRNRTFFRTVFFVLLLLMSAAGLKADSLTVVLDQSTVTVLQGAASVMFDGTISNPSATNTIFLNGDNVPVASAFFSLDDTAFLLNAPLFLSPGQGSGDIALFSLMLTPNIPVGVYTGDFQILGGADGGSGTAFTDIADASFTVNVQPVVVKPVPEPPALILMGVGMLIAVLLARKFA